MRKIHLKSFTLFKIVSRKLQKYLIRYTFLATEYLVKQGWGHFSFLVVQCYSMAQASLIAQLVKNPPAMQEAPVRFPSQEDLLEKG